MTDTAPKVIVIPAKVETPQDQEKRRHLRVAAYCRVSTDSEEQFTSYQNQLAYYTEKIMKETGWTMAGLFADDGYSGENFDRPGVTALLEAAKSGTIQCIVVKDLSCFGRDYIIMGNYVSRVFPFLGIRFIAVNDHFDSKHRGDIDGIDASFKALIYDLYSRDLSRKVRSAKKKLAEKGVYINPVAPYGYRRDPCDKHLLVPDPATAVVVRCIFSLVADSYTTEMVARVLNVEGLPTPSKVKAGTPMAAANSLHHHP